MPTVFIQPFSKSREFDDHELVSVFEDERTKLRGFVAIHSTKLGPAVGGTRMYPYHSMTDALEDALRLSRAMTYKCAIAGVTYGGGKAVIMGNPDKLKTKDFLAAYAKRVNLFDGNFSTGEDVGISESDVQYMLTQAPCFIGKSNQAGDPSPYAAMSTFRSIKVAVRFLYKKDSLNGMSIAIKGVGKVGSALAKLCANEGATIIIADSNARAIQQTLKLVPNAKVVSPRLIAKQKVHVYAPCALGGELTSQSISILKAEIVCGGANNQLANSEIGQLLHDQNIWYVPDFVANAGGLINVVDELEPNGYHKQRVLERIEKLDATLLKILTEAKRHSRSPNDVAMSMVHEILNKN